MKKYYFALTNWTRKNPAGMLERSSKVLEMLSKNPGFPEPKVPLTDFNKQRSSLQVAYNNRGNGKIARLALANTGEVMDISLRTQAIYVTETANGDNILIESSGYDASKDGSKKSVVPDMPTNVKLESKNCNVCLITRKPAGAASMCWIVYYGEVKESVTVENNVLSVPPGVSAQIITAGKCREVLMGLRPGTLVTAQVMAQNAAGCSALSDAVSIYVNR